LIFKNNAQALNFKFILRLFSLFNSYLDVHNLEYGLFSGIKGLITTFWILSYNYGLYSENKTKIGVESSFTEVY
jgi:hypothetical protein